VNATVVYVHGIGNKLPRDVLEGVWDQALSGHSSSTHSRLAYGLPFAVQLHFLQNPMSGKSSVPLLEAISKLLVFSQRRLL
jgi:hypothetical protein